MLLPRLSPFLYVPGFFATESNPPQVYSGHSSGLDENNYVNRITREMEEEKTMMWSRV